MRCILHVYALYVGLRMRSIPPCLILSPLVFAETRSPLSMRRPFVPRCTCMQYAIAMMNVGSSLTSRRCCRTEGLPGSGFPLTVNMFVACALQAGTRRRLVCLSDDSNQRHCNAACVPLSFARPPIRGATTVTYVHAVVFMHIHT
ncbi:hypothetical protein F4805DRAFT_89275 [Annulohypoxylon moriforme]|nr:hypothetical protein F4805DRAFT_89275 [Annulohypoxylon moriforme]